MLKWINKIFGSDRYVGHPEAVVISCYFNPMGSPYRLQAFNQWYESIKHLNHRIIECVIGDSQPQLPESPCIERVTSDSLLWHKEALLNRIIKNLPSQFKYVFWVDADVLFTNKNWLVDGVHQMSVCERNIIQPFEYCIHLDRDEQEPSFKPSDFYVKAGMPTQRPKSMWRSFASNWVSHRRAAESENYDYHGHVGFAWGARRSKLGYVSGDLYHLWYGDIDKRQYLKRIQDFTATTKKIRTKDSNGLYVSSGHEDAQYMRRYFQQREVSKCDHHDDGFMQSMAIGYLTDSPVMGGLLGGNWGGAFVGAAMAPHHASAHAVVEDITTPAAPALSHPEAMATPGTYQTNDQDNATTVPADTQPESETSPNFS